eukprot:1654522-Rhodomonas_salina.2
MCPRLLSRSSCLVFASLSTPCPVSPIALRLSLTQARCPSSPPFPSLFLSSLLPSPLSLQDAIARLQLERVARLTAQKNAALQAAYDNESQLRANEVMDHDCSRLL